MSYFDSPKNRAIWERELNGLRAERERRKREGYRPQIDEKQARLLMSQQISIEKKKEMGDYIIDNRQNFEDLYVQIERVLEVLKNEIVRH